MKTIKYLIHKKAVTNNIFLFISIAIFSLLFLPFISSIPYLDGNINFVQTIFFHEGGFNTYFNHFSSIHPPLKILLLNALYNIFGINKEIFSFLGFLWGILGITSFYFFAKKIFPKSENLGSILFALNPLFLSAGIFGLTDYVITCLTLTALAAYVWCKKVILLISIFGLVSVKETGLLIPIIFLIIEFLQFIKNRHHKEKKIFFILLSPIIIYYFWTVFIKINNKTSWKDWIFAETADKGTFYTIFNNIITLKIFNEYAAQHFLQLFFLNFNWIIIAISLILSFLLLKKRSNRKAFIKTVLSLNQKSKAIIFIFLFCISYSLTVLTLQTYTIPRYALPIIPFLTLWFSLVVTQLKNFFIKVIAISIIFLFTILGLFFSIDPIANALWGKVEVLGQNIYATNYHLSGNDGFTYNFQYLLILKNRTETLHGKSFTINECLYLFPDPRNDYIALKTLDLLNSNAVKTCIILSSQ